MATLISPIKHTVKRNFRIDIRTVKEKVFVFEPGVPVDDIPDEFAKSLHDTYYEKYFYPEEWKAKEGIEESADFPSLEKLEATELHELKKIADELGIKYGQNISSKTLANRIYEHYTAPDEDTASTDEPISVGE